MTDLRYSELEEELRASVRSLLAGRGSPLGWVEHGEAYDAVLWRQVAGEMGLAGIAVSQSLGGGGASLREVAVVLEELGRAVAPVPYLSSGVVATTTLLAAGDDSLVPALAAGERVAVLAMPFTASPFGSRPTTVSVTAGRLNGAVTSVADGLAADVLLVATDKGLYAVDATAPGVARTAVVSFDLTRPVADLTFTDVSGSLVCDDVEGPVSAGLLAGAALLASEQLGIAEWCLDTTVEYARTRHQFGRPIGSFQAIKHRLADLWVDITQARAVARYAAVCAASGDADLAVAASLAQAFCAPVAVKAAEECIQLHGGIGFTWEHPAHLYLKRAKSDALAFGTPDRHRWRIGELVDLPPPRS